MHSIDPRIKWCTFIPFVCVLALANGSLQVPLGGLATGLFLTFLGRLDSKILLNRLVYVNLFVFLLLLLVPLSYPGKALWSLGFLTATREGYLYVLEVAVKVNAIVLTTISVLGTTAISSLAHALIHLKFPKKLIILFFFFYRYISVLHHEFSSLYKAAQIRGFVPGTNLHTYRTYGYLIGTLLLRSFDRSLKIYQALLCRGFDGNFPVMRHFTIKKGDLVYLALFGTLTILMGTQI